MKKWRLPSALVLGLGLLFVFGASCWPDSEVPEDVIPAEHPGDINPDELADNPCGPTSWDEPPPEVTSLDD